MRQEEISTTLSIVDSSGRQVSILNSTQPSRPHVTQPQPQSSKQHHQHHYHQQEVTLMEASTTPIKRKYICNESGCFKSFSTSGHLSRHYRIHSGEKNFPCVFPSCKSLFSRHDNMMQHYRTHMSPKSRRPKKQSDDRSQPRLHAHNRIISDVTTPLTIDQHLHNYHQSRTYHRHPQHQHQQHMRTPSSKTTTVNSGTSSFSTELRGRQNNYATSSPIPSVLSSSSPPSPQLLPSFSSSSSTIQKHISIDSCSSGDIFYKHRPLLYTKCQDTNPTTLLNPTPFDKHNHHSLPSTLTPASPPPPLTKTENDTASNSLIQLANVVSSFG